MELPSPVTGVILEIRRQEDETVPVNEVLCLIGAVEDKMGDEKAGDVTWRHRIYSLTAALASALAWFALLIGLPIGLVGLLTPNWRLALLGPMLLSDAGYFLVHFARNLLVVLGVKNRYVALFDGDYTRRSHPGGHALRNRRVSALSSDSV